MSLLYTVVKMGNPSKQEDVKKFYLRSKIRGSKKHRQILTDAAKNNALNFKEVDTSVYCFFQSLFAALADGFSVEVEGLGTFSTSISSTGVKTEAEATPARLKRISLAFRPKPEVRKMISEFKLEKYIPNKTL